MVALAVGREADADSRCVALWNGGTNDGRRRQHHETRVDRSDLCRGHILQEARTLDPRFKIRRITSEPHRPESTALVEIGRSRLGVRPGHLNFGA